MGRYTEKVAHLLLSTKPGLRVAEGRGAVGRAWQPRHRDRLLRVLGHTHRYPPSHNAGAEMMLHALLRHMAARGHEVRVLMRDGGLRHDYEHEGVLVSPADRKGDAYGWAEVVVTHLDCTVEVVGLASSRDLPVVHLVHNDRQLVANKVRPGPKTLAVFNSRWLSEATIWPGRWLIVRPPVVAADYRVERPGSSILLANLTEAKGAEVFYALARAMPDRAFLGVRGAYGHQIVRELPNVTLEHHTPAMREMYARTRIVLMPSSYESWGRVGIEAAASGIPTIAHPTPGLRESLGHAGIFVDRGDLGGWARAIERLDDPGAYQEASDRAAGRSVELDPTADLERFEAALVSFVGLAAAA